MSYPFFFDAPHPASESAFERSERKNRIALEHPAQSGVLNLLEYDDKDSHLEAKAMKELPKKIGRFLISQIPIVNLIYAAQVLSKDIAGEALFEYGELLSDAFKSSIKRSDTLRQKAVSEIIGQPSHPLGVISFLTSIFSTISSGLALLSATKRDSQIKEVRERMAKDFSQAEKKLKAHLLSNIKRVDNDFNAQKYLRLSSEQARLILLGRDKSFVKRHIYDGRETVDLTKMPLEKLSIMLGKLEAGVDNLLIKTIQSALLKKIENYNNVDKSALMKHVGAISALTALQSAKVNLAKLEEKSNHMVRLRQLMFGLAIVNLIAISIVFTGVTLGVVPLFLVSTMMVVTFIVSAVQVAMSLSCFLLEPKKAMPKIAGSLGQISASHKAFKLPEEESIKKISDKKMPVLYDDDQSREKDQLKETACKFS